MTMKRWQLILPDGKHTGCLREAKSLRTVTMRGINVDASCKLPATPHVTTYTKQDDSFWDGDNVSFVGRPFPLDEAPEHLLRIKSLGFNTIRYVYTWEALEHSGPGQYDEDFITYTIEMLEIIKNHGFYVFMDPHQDIWGRFSGGSGAPLWTYYAVGLDPTKFKATEAALIQNSWLPDPQDFPVMIWATNYWRSAAQIMFTAFFGGEMYLPKAVINGQNIQHYLQDHMLQAMVHLYTRIREETDLFETCIFAVENMNEPSIGLIGQHDITVIPGTQNLRLGTTPTAFESMMLSSGIACEVDYYTFGKFGPEKKAKRLVDPGGESIWLSPTLTKKLDSKYGFQRSPEWDVSKCIWAQHGVWDIESRTCLLPNYFASIDEGYTEEAYAVNRFYKQYWASYFKTMRKTVGEEIFIMCQPPTLAIPPLLKGTDLIDDRVIYAPHFYDGLTMMLKQWSTLYNVDSLGYLRGKYRFPYMALRFGERSIRNCIAEELQTIREEGKQYLGETVPCIMTETGVPFNMNKNDSYYKTGDYSSQTKALDAISSGLEKSLFGYTLWCYSYANSHVYGDYWNGEDFGVYSTDPLLEPKPEPDTTTLTPASSYSSSEKSATLVKTQTVASSGTATSITETPFANIRAIASLCRPYPVKVKGDLVGYGFDLNSQTFTLTIIAKHEDGSEESQLATEVFIPIVHYESEEEMSVELSSGKWELDQSKSLLLWWHDFDDSEQQQTLKISPRQGEKSENICNCTVM